MKKTIIFMTFGIMTLLCGCGKTKDIMQNQVGEEKDTVVVVGKDSLVNESGQYIDESSAISNVAEDKMMSRDKKEIKAYLAAFPEELSELQKKDCYIVLHGQENHGREYLDAFLDSVDKGEQAELVSVEFTIEGDPVIYYLNYDGNDFYCVEDYSRDAFIGDGSKYDEVTYSNLHVITGTEDNGDDYQYIILSDETDVTMDDLMEEWLKSYQAGKQKFFQISYAVLGNQNAITTGEESWNDLATEYDESKVLVDVEQIASITVFNGNTGDEKTFVKEDSEFADIISKYQALDFDINPSLDGRSGYAYRIVLLDQDGNYLQNVTPYKDAVTIDGNIYDGSMNGTSTELLLYLDLLW